MSDDLTAAYAAKQWRKAMERKQSEMIGELFARVQRLEDQVNESGANEATEHDPRERDRSAKS